MQTTPKDVYLQMATNNRKLVMLVLLFPVVLFAFIYFWLWLFFNLGETGESLTDVVSFQELLAFLLPIVVIICLGMTLLSIANGKNMILRLAGAQLCPDDKEHIKVFHAVENVALAAGLPTPQVYLIDDKALNAFATGYAPKSAAITLTTGLIERLTPLELEAVIAHEMGHILNRDIRLNLYIITGIGMIGLVGEFLLRSCRGGRRSRNQGKAVIILLAVGLALYLFHILVAPFLRMAVSRTQEFQADATSAHLTRNPQALADALAKISENPIAINLSEEKALSAMCICSPLLNAGHLLDTHPPIKDRIARLEAMS